MLPELDGGGVERGTLEIGRHLSSHGHRSFVVSGGGRLVKQLEDEGSIHVSMDVGIKSPISLKYVLPLRQLILKEGVDVLHLRSRLPAWVGYLAWKSIPAARRPLLVTTFHGYYSVNVYSAIMTKGEAIIAVSDSIRKHIAENYGKKDNVTTIHRGVDGDTFKTECLDINRIEKLRTTWQINADKRVIMLPGRFSRWKGQDVFLKSLNQLKSDNYIAVLVGDPKENENYNKELLDIINKYKLQDRVKMVGHCDDMPTAYTLADIVISASSNEPEAFGRVSIEAMGMGKPVIATAHGGSLETVRHNDTGWLVQPSDAVDLAKAIDSALSLTNDELEAIGKRGKIRVAQKFTTQSMCDKTLALYHQWLNEKSVIHDCETERGSVSIIKS